MTTPELRLPKPDGPPPAEPDGARTSLIARLANELFSEIRRDDTAQALVPAPAIGYDAVHPIQDPLATPPPDKPPKLSPKWPKPSLVDPQEALYAPTLGSGVPSGGALLSPARGLPSAPGYLTDPGPYAAALGKPVDAQDYYFLAGSQPIPTGIALAHDPGGITSPAILAAGAGGIAPSIPSGGSLDPEAIRRDFPVLHQRVNGHRLIWLDNAATTQKPSAVINSISRFYEHDNSNIHRGAHTLAARATDAFEGAREKLRAFIGANEAAEIIFVRGTTEGINLVAQTYGRKNIGRGDEILISTIEHHANIVPWQLLAQETGATLRVAPVNDRGELLLDQFTSLLSARTKIVSVTHVANALGTINPIEVIIPLAHSYGAPVLVDAAQSSPHIPLNVSALDADFLVLSGHKIYGPTGIGIVYGKRAILEDLPPWQGGGHMIKNVTFSRTTFAGIPEKFEAGTPDIGGAVGLGAAIDYLTGIGLPAIAAYEHELLEYATARIGSVPNLRLIGTAAAKASVLSFVIGGHSATDVARHLDQHGIAARSGHHCAQPALRRFGVEETVRPSLAIYNTHEDVDALVWALHRLPKRETNREPPGGP